MRYAYSWNGFLVMPDDLISFAWSAPMRELAAKAGMSDVGLKKLLASYGVVAPPQGYWNKLRAGKPVPPQPKASARKPGETGRRRVDERFAGLIAPAKPLASTGPFASPAVPEELGELYAAELQRIGRAGVPKTLDGAHRALVPILKQEERRRQKDIASAWNWDKPKFDNPVAKRRLRILNGIFLALSKRGHDGALNERDGELDAHAIIGDTSVGLNIGVLGRHRTVMIQGYTRPAPDLPASTPLVLHLNPSFDGKSGQSWHDDEDGKLESKIATIAASVIVAGEEGFRRGLREAEERRERERIEAEERRRKALDELNRKRVRDLHESGELLRQAQQIRALAQRVGDAMTGQEGIDPAEIEAWQQWALSEADRLDPILSGQVLSHLRAPKLN